VQQSWQNGDNVGIDDASFDILKILFKSKLISAIIFLLIFERKLYFNYRATKIALTNVLEGEQNERDFIVFSLNFPCFTFLIDNQYARINEDSAITVQINENISTSYSIIYSSFRFIKSTFLTIDHLKTIRLFDILIEEYRLWINQKVIPIAC